jgi:hypothetical protein
MCGPGQLRGDARDAGNSIEAAQADVEAGAIGSRKLAMPGAGAPEVRWTARMEGAQRVGVFPDTALRIGPGAIA